MDNEVATMGMGSLQAVFTYDNSELRTVVIGEEPWFVAKDACLILEIKNVSDATRRLDDDEKGIVSIDTLGGRQDMVCVNEPGLYGLIFGSRKKEAKSFKRWVTHDVIPEIRKTGSYNAPAPVPALPSTYLEALKALVVSVEDNERLVAENLLMSPKAESYDAFIDAGTAIKMAQMANILGPTTGQNRLFKFLRQEKILIDAKGTQRHNSPYQKYIDAGYFTVRPRTVERTDPADDFNVTVTHVTPKGVEFISKLWNGKP